MSSRNIDVLWDDNQVDITSEANFIWSIANKLRGVYMPDKYGFIDRYSGDKLVNPGILKVLSYYMPDVFPYHAHWKMEECHNAYWEFIPTVDHIYIQLQWVEQIQWKTGQQRPCFIIP